MPTDPAPLRNATPSVLTGVNAAGVPTGNFGGVSVNGDLSVSDGISGGGVNGLLTATTANIAVEVKVGGSALANRKLLTFQAVDADFYWGYSNAVTSGASGNGTLIKKGATAKWQIDPTSVTAVTIYVISVTASAHGKVTESP